MQVRELHKHLLLKYQPMLATMKQCVYTSGMKQMQVYIEDDEFKRLKKFAVDTDVSLSAMIRAIVKSYLTKHNR